MDIETLLLDVGNTRTKYQVSNNDTKVISTEAEFLELLSTTEIGLAVISSVNRQAERWIELLRQASIRVELVSVKPELMGLKAGYQDVTRLGVDRWLAMLAGVDLCEGSNLLVVDSGTCLTLDAVSKAGLHLGGAIAPGLSTASKALNHYTSALPLVPVALQDEFGQNTEDCILFGINMQTVGLINQAMVRLGDSTKLLLTGGDATILSELLDHDHKVLPDLVLHGLKVYCREILSKES